MGIVDPRHPAGPQGTAMSRVADGLRRAAAGTFLGSRGSRATRSSASRAFRAVRPSGADRGPVGPARSPGPAAQRQPRRDLHRGRHRGVPRPDVLDLRGGAVRHTVNSLAWWDFRSTWFLEEHDAPRQHRGRRSRRWRRRLSTRLAERVRDNRGAFVRPTTARCTPPPRCHRGISRADGRRGSPRAVPMTP